jgi:hypothetical protein
MNTMKLLTALSLLGLASVSLSCDVLECGEGTQERNGECVAADGTIPDVDSCGEGTHYDATLLACIPDFAATICDDDTTEPIPDENGVIHCMGTGGGGCSLPCPVPATNPNTICGQLVNAEDNAPIEADDVSGEPGRVCDPEVPDATGPCALEVSFYDALSFAQNPTGTPPLTTDSTTINNCGRYSGINMPTPALGFLAVGVDDAGESPSDNWILSGVAFPAAPGDRRPDQVTFVVAVTTDEAWTDSAGSPFGNTTFAEKGVFFPIFLNDEVPVPGVKITRDPGVPVPADDYYFDDADPFTRVSVNISQDSTGANGAGLMVNSDLVDHGGEGGTGFPAECSWPEDLAKSIPGVVFANERHAEETSTGEPCGE